MRTAVIHTWLLAALAVGSQAAFAPRALAQGATASLTTTAHVLAAGEVTAEAPLSFGTIFPGVAKTVDATAATAARFGGSFPPDARLGLTLALPTQLTSGSDALPAGAWTALFSQSPSSAGATAISTTESTIVRAHPESGALTVFVGGSVTPAVAQPSGVYVGVITLTAAFAGY